MTDKNKKDDIAAKDVFILLGVPVPDKLIVDSYRDEENYESDWSEMEGIKKKKVKQNYEDDESQFTPDEDDAVQVEMITGPPVIDVTCPTESDDSSGYSITESEYEDNRWYDPSSTIGLSMSEYDTTKKLLKAIRRGDQTKTVSALAILKSNRITDEAFQNMFIAQKGIELLINILETDYDECIKVTLSIIRDMSQLFGTKHALCNLGAVQVLINLLSSKSIDIQNMSADILTNISRIKKGRKFMRKLGGIPMMVHLIHVPDELLSNPSTKLNTKQKKSLNLLCTCCKALQIICRSHKSRENIRYTGFIKLLPKLLDSVHSEVQISTMGVIVECCRNRSKECSNINNNNYRTDIVYKLSVMELGLLPKIIGFLKSDNITQIADAAETLLCLSNDDPTVNNILFKNNGLDTIFNIFKKYYNEPRVMVIVTAILWKCSVDQKLRNNLEAKNCGKLMLSLLTYEYDDEVIGNAIGTLSELWKCKSMQMQIMTTALPIYLQLLRNSQHNIVLSQVCVALGRAADDPGCMKMIDEAEGLRWVFVLLPSREVDEFHKYEYFYNTDVIVAATDCLIKFIKNSPPNLNKVKGMFQAVNDLVDLLKHTNKNVVSAVCRLVEAIAIHNESLRFMTDADVVMNLINLMYHKDPILRANLCRALGKCCYSGSNSRDIGKQNVIERLYEYILEEDKLVNESVPLALLGLSEDPLNCIKIDTIGFLPFLKSSLESNNKETAMAAANCLRNVRKVCSSIGKYKECKRIQ
ncbi:armadillo repeat-containing protein gudu-like [Daktulosphaira vitifoliae]|uniref:armadillo repeat-containing protein gudu-like n=1 Tax=Daktulosphaira vitifoliae TaxID=58002 RepID=UPI0021AABAE6|nr:armadillo repeat-containing protein gudu-like [Daktulosphaira vitifoliae]